MPSTLETPVLTVDANVIHKIDTANPQNLFSMWPVFSKCVDSVEQGRRLENLSWRLWTRETFCVEERQSFATSRPKNIPETARIPEPPTLSESVDSIIDEEAVEFAESGPLDIRPVIRRQDSCASSRSRGRERHITSDDLEKMVVDIIQNPEPLRPIHTLTVVEKIEEPTERPALERTGSTTTEESIDKNSEDHSEASQQSFSSESPAKTTTVVRGFSPSSAQLPTIRPVTLQATHAIPEPTSSPAAKQVQPKKPKFALGGSSSPEDSFSEDASSLDVRKPAAHTSKKMFKLGASSGEESSGKSSIRPSHMLSVKHAARSAQSAPAVADDSDTEGDYVDESAIDDDDDSSDWEDSMEDSGKSSIDDKTYFQRVDSKANLTSRRSLITLMIEQNERRIGRIGNMTSQSTPALNRARPAHHGPAMVASPADSEGAPLMMKRSTRGTPLKPINEVTRTPAQPIMSNNHAHHQAALSPRTTRRNMLATELTESLRRHLLWERQQKTSTANAVLKRRHTSHDVANLKQYPERAYMNRSEDANASSWNEYWTKEAFTGYHTQGW